MPLERISPFVVAATLATEDKLYYQHPGYDLWAIVRAVWQNLQGGEVVSGASTITQQVTRNLLFTPEERTRISALRKIREVLLAAEITRTYSKDAILELYLNQNNYGNLAYGIEAAAETYFDTTADRLTLTQASFLAGLVQAPAVYDVYTNREVTLNRQRQVLGLMVEASLEAGCIFVGDSDPALCITPEEAGAAAAELENFTFHTPDVFMRYPHWVNYVRTLLESMYDPQTIYRSGFTVHTTLDPALQDEAERLIHDQVASLTELNVTDGALVAVRPATGEIVAMVGSADFYDEAHAGQVNMAIRPRQPGSSMKPMTYTAAFEKGWTPATLIWDVPSEFPPSGDPNDPREPYKPVNYDERFHGPITVRSALANSYNVPAVKALDFVGIYDRPDTPQNEGLIAFAQRLGITTLTRSDYGLALTLGGGEVTPLEFTAAYAAYANGGQRIPTFAITRIDDYTGQTVYEHQAPAAEPVIRPEHAYLINSILSDNAARTPAFGPNSVLNLPFPAAVKTGTTNDFRDNWTMGWTPDLAVGVWIGNADYTPMGKISGVTGAAPVWNAFMQFAVPRLTDNQPTAFARPSSHRRPGRVCPVRRGAVRMVPGPTPGAVHTRPASASGREGSVAARLGRQLLARARFRRLPRLRHRTRRSGGHRSMGAEMAQGKLTGTDVPRRPSGHQEGRSVLHSNHGLLRQLAAPGGGLQLSVRRIRRHLRPAGDLRPGLGAVGLQGLGARVRHRQQSRSMARSGDQLVGAARPGQADGLGSGRRPQRPDHAPADGAQHQQRQGRRRAAFDRQSADAHTDADPDGHPHPDAGAVSDPDPHADRDTHPDRELRRRSRRRAIHRTPFSSGSNSPKERDPIAPVWIPCPS